ncbi:hypothetical protein IT575_03495 [bacterium]|nr:hypothetical protein [bacterium]
MPKGTKAIRALVAFGAAGTVLVLAWWVCDFQSMALWGWQPEVAQFTDIPQATRTRLAALDLADYFSTAIPEQQSHIYPGNLALNSVEVSSLSTQELRLVRSLSWQNGQTFHGTLPIYKAMSFYAEHGRLPQDGQELVVASSGILATAEGHLTISDAAFDTAIDKDKLTLVKSGINAATGKLITSFESGGEPYGIRIVPLRGFGSIRKTRGGSIPPVQVGAKRSEKIQQGFHVTVYGAKVRTVLFSGHFWMTLSENGNWCPGRDFTSF